MEPTELAPERNESEMLERALELESSGKRNLISENFLDAVADLSESCQILGELYGDASDKCASVHYAYGNALLGLAREENAVVGGDSGDDASDGENQEPDKPEASSNAAAPEPSIPNGENEADPDAAVDEEGDEDVSNLQLAWEVLDLARKSFEKEYSDDNFESGARLANTLRALGEVAMESDNYAQAIEDFQQCLEIQIKILKEEDRSLSETYFNMASAFVCTGDTGKAIEQYKNSIDVLERRLSSLRKDVDSSDKDDDAKKAAGEEIEELEKVVLDIQERIEDTVELKRETKETVEMLKPKVEKQVFAAVLGESATGFGSSSNGFGEAGFGEASSSFGSPPSTASSSKPVNVITALKRKAPKADEKSEADEKKTKVDA